MNSKNILIITKSFIRKPTISNNNRKLFHYDKEKANITWEQGRIVKNVLSNYYNNIDMMSYKEIEESLINEENYNKINKYDYIFSIGGDGTFLTCGHIINNNKQLLLGINSNPKKSHGYLCQVDFDIKKIENIINRIIENKYNILKRKRYIIDLYNENDKKIVHFFGLNEVFFGSKDNSSTFRYDFKTNNHSYNNLRSTGCIIYTGTGSTGWARSMKKITKDKVQNIINIYNDLNINKINNNNIENINNNINKKISEIEIKEITDRYNSGIKMHPSYDKMRFLHREIFNGIDESVPIEGENTYFEIINKTYNGFLAFDGYYFGMNLNDKAVIKISDNNMDLHCFDFK